MIKTFTILLNICSAFGVQAENNNHFLLAPEKVTDRREWLEDAQKYHEINREVIEQKAGRNAWRIYDRKDLSWMSSDFTCRMCMMFALDFYDPATDEYLIDSVLVDGIKEFGGYDSIVLWQAYPRLGIDERNQFDFYRDMPGGLTGIKAIVNKCHSKNVRVFIDYNPWDTGTRREGNSDLDALVEMVLAIEADGI